MVISLIANAPDAGAVERLRVEVKRLRGAGHEVRPHLTFEGGDAARFAREEAEQGCELVITAGGDGTINEVVNGLQAFLSGCDGRAPCPRLGVIPLGTGNDFAGELALPQDPSAAVETAISGDVLHIDVATVNERCFVNVSTGGFGAEATEETPEETKRTLGTLAYLITGVKKFATLEVSSARFEADDVVYEGPFLLYAVGNSRRTGGGNRLTPRADLTDGHLDLCVVKEMSRMDFVRLMPELRTGKHLDHPAVLYTQVRHVRVDSREELSVNADGEPLHASHLDYRVSPHRLPLMVPVSKVG